MKKFLLFAAAIVLSIGFASAQNKHKVAYDYAKCTKGTWGLGFQAMYRHNADVNFQTGIYAKYFISDKWALRTNVRFGRDWTKGTDPEFITDTQYNGEGDNNNDYYTDPDDLSQTTIRKSNFMLIVGAEHRHRLSNRFFGYYGADFGVGGYGQIRRSFDENGEMEELVKQNRSCDVSIQPFIGMEFFIGPRISLGLEAGYDVLFKFYQKGYYTDDYKNTIEKINQFTSIASHINFGNCVFGTAKVAFYF